jgi:hypothetical protein
MKSLVRSSFQISQDYYPETMGRLLVINAPSSFTAIWTVVKPWLAKDTVGKIDILGGNYREVLIDVVGEENLPEGFGGKCKCVGGCEIGSEGPWMEERRARKLEKEKGEMKGEERAVPMANGEVKPQAEEHGMPNGHGRSSPSPPRHAPVESEHTPAGGRAVGAA